MSPEGVPRTLFAAVQGADRERVLAEAVGVVGGGEVGGAFADLGIDGRGMARVRSSISACVWGVRGADGREGRRFGAGLSSAITDSALGYKDSANFQDAHRHPGR